MNIFLNSLAVINFLLIFLYTLPGLGYFVLLSLIGLLLGDRGKPLQHYALRNMVAPDQWWNAALRGEEDETVSSRLGRAIKSGRAKWLAKMLAHLVNGMFRLAGQKNHVLESIEKRYENGAPSDERLSFIKEDKAA